MFNNIGSKIMKLAKVLCWLGIIASVIAGILIMVVGANINASVSRSYYYSSSNSNSNGSFILTGFLTMILGSLFSWIGSFFTYGFGQLIENTDYIRNNTQRKD